MPVSIRDIAVFEAVQTQWLAMGLAQLIPSGIFWGDVPDDTPQPYCEFASGGVAKTLTTNKSVYRDYPVTFKVYDRDQALAGELVNEIANRFEESQYLFSLPLGEGKVYSVDRMVVNFIESDETTWASFVDFVIRRCAPRTRPSRQ